MTTANDIHWEHYEELVKDIYLALGGASGVTIECWGRSCKVEGPPGVFSQVDVLANHSDGFQLYRTAISCKYWALRVGVREVRDLAQVVQGARLNKGVIVSKMGFTKPARDLAAAEAISLVELRRPLDKDWEGLIRDIHVRILVDPPARIYDLEMKLVPDANGETTRIGLTLNAQELFVGGPNQETASLAHLIEKAMQAERKDEYELSFPEASALSVSDPSHIVYGKMIKSLRFKAEYPPPIELETVVRGDDYVYMIMESIFDGRCFRITTDGQITEVTPASN